MHKATVEIKLRPSILDPQGKATLRSLESLGHSKIDQVRIGKLIELWVDEDDEAKAEEIVKESCEKLLANAVMEDYTIRLERITENA